MFDRRPDQNRQAASLDHLPEAELGVRRIDPRAPALALAALVQQEGQEAPRAVYRAFREFNEEHFEGRLQQSMLLITHPSSPRTLGDYVPKDEHGIPSRIRIAPRCAHVGLLYVLDVLLHEMVHAWQQEVIGDLELGYDGHGPLFAKQCNVIGSKLGLAEVAPKGRRGKPKAAQWPMCVRPAGYYGPNDPRDRRRPDDGDDPSADREAGSPVKVGVLIAGLETHDVAFLALLGAAAGVDVAMMVRRLAVEEARRIVAGGGQGAQLVADALERYESTLSGGIEAGP